MSFGVSGGGGGKKAKGGVLVPPPPPLMPVFSSAPPPPSSGFELKTKVRIQSDKEPAVKKSKPARPPVVDPDKDFDEILDWAEVDKKKKTKSVP
jgi:hypothetical protein